MTFHITVSAHEFPRFLATLNPDLEVIRLKFSLSDGRTTTVNRTTAVFGLSASVIVRDPEITDNEWFCSPVSNNVSSMIRVTLESIN